MQMLKSDWLSHCRLIKSVSTSVRLKGPNYTTNRIKMVRVPKINVSAILLGRTGKIGRRTRAGISVSFSVLLEKN